MLKSKYKRALAIFLLIFVLPPVPDLFAQSFTNSPYSRFGIGDLNKVWFPQSAALGGAGFGLRSNSNFNINNPASFSAFDLTVFEVGVNNNYQQIRNDEIVQTANNLSLGYLAFGIPLTKKWGLTFGLVPFSSVGYKITNSIIDSTLGNIKYSYDGNGGLNKVFIGNAVQWGDFSFGLTGSFLFGNILRERRVAFEDPQNIYLFTRVAEEISVSDFTFDFGTQYIHKMSESLNLTVGAIYNLSSELNARRNLMAVTFDRSSMGIERDRDTILNESTKGGIKLPTTFGGGLALEKSNKWILALDYSSTIWSSYKAFGQSDSLANSSRISLGGQYTPEHNSQTYWKLIQYRAGLRYSETYLNLNGIQLKEFGISFGGGFPLRRSRSLINLSVELGERGTTDKNLIKERFVNAKLGITINDKWFIKRKYD